VLDPGHRELSALPWELLFDREEDGFLSLNHRTPIVRYLERETPADPRLDPATRPLRVLVACAVPEDAQALQIERETERIVEALRRRRDIRVEAIYKTTVQDLRDGLRDFSPHVLHVIAHGEIEGGKGALVLRTSAGYSERLGGEHLSTKLRGCHDLRLVVLNACDTAFLPREEGLDPFSSVAAVLVRRHKLPAVVAMQFPITDEAAVAFGGALYASLAAGDPVEAAISEGRQAIYDRDQDYGSFEWATPVLYLRVDSGQIFRFGSDTLPP
jgi:CHAT domain-containing protein